MTRETDYALRILRALMDGQRHTAGALAQGELIPLPFTYKILKKLEQAGFIRVSRGVEGGCELTADPDQVSLYDVMAAVDQTGWLSACTQPGHHCSWRTAHGGDCSIHCRLVEIQRQLDNALRAQSLRAILTPG